MNKHILFCMSFFLLTTVKAEAQAQDSFSVRAQRYIEKYYSLAMAEQARSGVPAAVTLAQGVLETEAGRSELACMANNHFGIKCKSDYGGDKFYHDDDAPKECFKMYKCVEDSYKDHSDYLKRNPRYNQLFTLSQTDYASWAVCLKKCGYATNPQYAQRLIKLIEDFKLQQYTYAAMDSTLLPDKTVAAVTMQQPVKQAEAKAVVATTPADTSAIVLTTPFPSGKVAPGQAARKAPVSVVPQPVAITEPVVATATTVTAPKEQVVASIETPAAAVPKAATPEPKREADTVHHIIVTDGPLPLQAKSNEQVADSPVEKVVKREQGNQPSLDTKYDSGKVIIVNGLKAFYAYKGEMLLQYAVKYNIRYPHLLEINDLPDGPLEANMPVYLEKKLTSGTHARHTVREGETMYMISQMEGMQLKRLLALNMMDIGDEPATGVILELQNGVFKKPALRAVSAAPQQGNMTVMLGKSTPPADMVATVKPKPEQRVDTVRQEKAKPYVETIPTEKTAATITNAVATTANTVTATPVVETIPVNTTSAAKEQPATTSANPLPKDVQPLEDASQAKDTTVDDLAALKAELDKVVYTDDSKLVAATRATQPKPAAQVKPEAKEHAKESTGNARKKKKADDDDDEEDDRKKGGNYYTIKEGETLGGIANRHNTTVKKLMQLNHIKADQIRAGKKLRIK